MARLSVDLMSRESLLTAQAVIHQRLADLGEEPQVQLEEGDEDELTPDLAAQIAGDLWRRVGGHTRDLIRAFAQAETPISLREIADLLDVDYDTIKARKFRFGRTEKLINNTWGIEMLTGVWDQKEGANRYEMEPEVAKALMELAPRGN